MATPKRFQGPGYFHVYTRATGGAPLFLDDCDRERLIGVLRRTATRLGWRIHVFCLMTTHYHWVIDTPRPNLSAGMQQINSCYVRRFNDRWARSGALVACRFGYRIIEDEDYLEEVCRYVLLNPVRAELCARAADWPWSGGTLFRVASEL